ncbi:hypothetical protein CFN78_20070 [Amycolatopsis antarctica]|uniref:Uncharacterized protein n=1 Tax=Amycolatopsis antarctica TaxID=1854586 RepID=A0A263D1D9_9PSEU|nr:hypothetical protein [Amycolatopsis antarctica]OZM71447.1 hypothetical protein CFN78_20070 [Amycolatopsis antarctica]
MNDRELETMFRGAAGEPPTPTFDASDVAAASRRATVRKRNAVTMACTCAVVVVAGLGVTGVVLENSGGTGDTSTAAQENAPVPDASGSVLAVPGQPGQVPARPPNADTPQNFPASPKQGGEDSGENGPRAGTSGCDKVDRELATALAGELPVTVEAQPTPGRFCPEGSRSAGLPVQAQDASGVLTASVYEAGSALPPRISGAVSDQRPTASGKVVVVFSVPGQGSAAAPFGGEVARIAAALAARY